MASPLLEKSSSMSFYSSSNEHDSNSSSSSEDEVYFKDDMANFEQFKQKLKLKRNKTTNIEETKQFSPFKDNFDSRLHTNVLDRLDNHSNE